MFRYDLTRAEWDLIDQQGWNDTTLGFLLASFDPGSDMTRLEHLQAVADEEKQGSEDLAALGI